MSCPKIQALDDGKGLRLVFPLATMFEKIGSAFTGSLLSYVLVVAIYPVLPIMFYILSAFIIVIAIRIYLGRQIVVLSKDGISVNRQYIGVSILAPKNYDAEQISALHYYSIWIRPARLFLAFVEKHRDGSIRFRYGKQAYSFGTSMNRRETESLIEYIRTTNILPTLCFAMESPFDKAD